MLSIIVTANHNDQYLQQKNKMTFLKLLFSILKFLLFLHVLMSKLILLF